MSRSPFTPLEEAMFDVRNGVVGAHCTTRGMREARKLGFIGYRRAYGEIKLTGKGWIAMHEIEAEKVK